MKSTYTGKEIPPFPFKANDVLRFPDTESEFVDVGIGLMKVAENTYFNLVVVRKWGRGFRLELEFRGSETFNLPFQGKGKQYISLQKYIDYFGNWDDLIFIDTEEDFLYWQTEEGNAELEKRAEELDIKHKIE